MILETLVGALGLFVLGGIYLALAPADRTPGDCGSCALEEDPTLCGGCGLPEAPPPDAERPPGPDGGPGGWLTETYDADEWRRPGEPGRENGWREERP